MSQFPHLSRAPIQEAIVDLRCKLPDEIDVSQLRDLERRVVGEYPNVVPIRAVDAQIRLSKRRTAVAVEDVATSRGFAFRADDPPRVVQFRLDGFTYNWLRPYDTWGALRDAARRQWDAYVEVARPEAVTRIALRYVNRFPIPLPANLEDYLMSPPRLPEGVPNQVHKFLFQWALEDPETEARCQLTIASERKPPDAVEVILDIDASRVEQHDPHDGSIWERFEELRILKNRTFFKSLTSQALKEFR